MKKGITIFFALVILACALFPINTVAASDTVFGQTIGIESFRRYAIKKDGTLWYWDDSGESKYPKKLMDDAVSVSTGDFSAIITKADGTHWFFGSGYAGDGTYYMDHKVPVKIPIDDVVSFAVGRAFCLALKSDGTVWAWGDNETDGQLGGGVIWNQKKPVKVFIGAESIAVGSNYSFAITEDHALWGWGYNGFGQLGIETESPYNPDAIKIMDGVKGVWCGGLGTFAIKDDNSLWCWGYHYYWDDELNEYFDKWPNGRPPMKLLDNVKIATGECFAILNDNSLWGWGYYGDGDTAKIMDGVADAVSGMGEALVLKQDGTLLWSGYASFDETMRDVAIPGTTLSIPSEWAQKEINIAALAGLVPEELQCKYGADITRQEFCTLAVKLYETVKGAEIKERKSFIDTTDINVEKMGALGIVTGVGGGRFDPGGTLTREQAATILARLAASTGKSLPEQTTAFADNTAISSWAKTQVGQVQATGIMGGVGNNTFDPKGSFTREQSIITMIRLYEFLTE